MVPGYLGSHLSRVIQPRWWTDRCGDSPKMQFSEPVFQTLAQQSIHIQVQIQSVPGYFSKLFKVFCHFLV